VRVDLISVRDETGPTRLGSSWGGSEEGEGMTVDS
jgi:hypothetical protein